MPNIQRRKIGITEGFRVCRQCGYIVHSEWEYIHAGLMHSKCAKTRDAAKAAPAAAQPK